MWQHDVACSTVSLHRLSNTVHAEGSESTELISSFLGELSTLLVYRSYFSVLHRPFMLLWQNLRIHNMLILVRKRHVWHLLIISLHRFQWAPKQAHLTMSLRKCCKATWDWFFRIVSLGEFKEWSVECWWTNLVFTCFYFLGDGSECLCSCA